MALLTSVPHDWMRIVAPIGPEPQVTDQHRKWMLEANFHSALDVQYATSNGLVYAAYIHPLSPLRREEIQSALRQVAENSRSVLQAHRQNPIDKKNRIARDSWTATA